MYKHVLVAVDLSEESEFLLKKLLKINRPILTYFPYLEKGFLLMSANLYLFFKPVFIWRK